jgi:hypothetical protein
MNNKTLPGTQIEFKQACSTGRTHRSFGVGDIDLSIHRPQSAYPWLDLGRINFASPTQEELLDAQTSPAFSDGANARVDINRRLSYKQAELVNTMIIHMLNKSFNGVIPADDEIADFLQVWKSKQ